MTTSPADTRLPDKEPDGKKLQGARVLVVDDHDDARELLAIVLEMEGAQVTQADSVRAALSAVASGEFDVLVSDIGMPGEDGYALIRQLRARVSGAHTIPAVAVTAFVSREERRAALAAGFQEHLAKPVDLRALVDVVARLAGSNESPARGL
jgi:CheY-like chemotaxis protein